MNKNHQSKKKSTDFIYESSINLNRIIKENRKSINNVIKA